MRIFSFRCHSSCCHWNDRAGLRMTGLTLEWQDGEGPGEAIPVQSPIIPASARHLGLIRKPLNHCGWGWNDKKFESEVLWFPWINCCQAFLFGTLALVRAWLGGPGVLLPSSLELSHFCRNFQRRGLGFMLNLKFCPFCGLRVPCGTIVGSITDQSELGMSTNACGQRCQAGLVTKVIWRKASWRWY